MPVPFSIQMLTSGNRQLHHLAMFDPSSHAHNVDVFVVAFGIFFQCDHRPPGIPFCIRSGGNFITKSFSSEVRFINLIFLGTETSAFSTPGKYSFSNCFASAIDALFAAFHLAVFFNVTHHPHINWNPQSGDRFRTCFSPFPRASGSP